MILGNLNAVIKPTAGGLDADAAAYIAAVETALGTGLTSTRKNAINAFVEAEKTSGRWTSLKRLWLPIYGNAAANAIDMVTRGTGTWVNSPTMASGYVQGNGTTQYFDGGFSMNGIGCSASTGFIGVLVNQAETRSDFRSFTGAQNGAGDPHCRFNVSAGLLQVRLFGAAREVSVSRTLAQSTGILTASRSSSTYLSLRVRKTSGVDAVGTNTGTATIAAPTQTQCFMALNNGSAISTHTNARFGAFFAGLGLDDSATDAFTANLKTLWETCTGLTLP